MGLVYSDKLVLGTGTTGGGGSGGEGVTKYAQLPDKPKINGVTLSGNKTSADLGLDVDLTPYEKTEDVDTKIATVNTNITTAVNNHNLDNQSHNDIRNSVKAVDDKVNNKADKVETDNTKIGNIAIVDKDGQYQVSDVNLEKDIENSIDAINQEIGTLTTDVKELKDNTAKVNEENTFVERNTFTKNLIIDVEDPKTSDESGIIFGDNNAILSNTNNKVILQNQKDESGNQKTYLGGDKLEIYAPDEVSIQTTTDIKIKRGNYTDGWNDYINIDSGNISNYLSSETGTVKTDTSLIGDGSTETPLKVKNPVADQEGHAGEVLTTDGEETFWTEASELFANTFADKTKENTFEKAQTFETGIVLKGTADEVSDIFFDKDSAIIDDETNQAILTNSRNNNNEQLTTLEGKHLTLTSDDVIDIVRKDVNGNPQTYKNIDSNNITDYIVPTDDKYGIEADYCTHYGITDYVDNEILTITGKKITINSGVIMRMAGPQAAKETQFSTESYDLDENIRGKIALFYAMEKDTEGTTIRRQCLPAKQIAWQDSEPKTVPDTGYIAWWSPARESWKFLSNEMGGVWYEASAAGPMASMTVNDTTITSPDYVGCLLVDRKSFAHMSDIESINETISVINNNIAENAALIENKLDTTTAASTYATKEELQQEASKVYHPKGSVATFADLPTENNQAGDVWNVQDTGKNYAWIIEDNKGSWDDLGGIVDLSDYVTTTQLNTEITKVTNEISDFDIFRSGVVKGNRATVYLQGNQVNKYIVAAYNEELETVETDAGFYRESNAVTYYSIRSANPIDGVIVTTQTEFPNGFESIDFAFVKREIEKDYVDLSDYATKSDVTTDINSAFKSQITDINKGLTEADLTDLTITDGLTITGGENGGLTVGFAGNTTTIATNDGLDIISETKFDKAVTTDDTTTYTDANLQSFVTKNQVQQAISALSDEYIEKNQGEDNAGKFLKVGIDGIVIASAETSSGGLTAVAHDDTLLGAGTDDDPLKVKPIIPEDGTEGQVLSKDADGLKWIDQVVPGITQAEADQLYATKEELTSKADEGDLGSMAFKSANDYATKQEAISLYAPKSLETTVENLTTTVNTKANSEDVYTKTEADGKFVEKAEDGKVVFENNPTVTTETSFADLPDDALVCKKQVNEAITGIEGDLQAVDNEVGDLTTKVDAINKELYGNGGTKDTPTAPSVISSINDQAGLISTLQDEKQNKLTAGTGISIENNTISTTINLSDYLTKENLTDDSIFMSAISETNKAITQDDLSGYTFSDELFVDNNNDISLGFKVNSDNSATISTNADKLNIDSTSIVANGIITTSDTTSYSEATNQALTTKAQVQEALSGKQDTLTAGDNVEITNNVIAMSKTPTFETITMSDSRLTYEDAYGYGNMLTAYSDGETAVDGNVTGVVFKHKTLGYTGSLTSSHTIVGNVQTNDVSLAANTSDGNEYCGIKCEINDGEELGTVVLENIKQIPLNDGIDTSVNSQKVPTTSWVQAVLAERFQVLSALPDEPTDGVFYFIEDNGVTA